MLDWAGSLLGSTIRAHGPEIGPHTQPTSQASLVDDCPARPRERSRHPGPAFVGIEAKGTSPTTEAMAADIANIAALDVRLFLIVSAGKRGRHLPEGGSCNQVELPGVCDVVIVLMDASFLPDSTRRSWPNRLHRSRSRNPAGRRRRVARVVWQRQTEASRDSRLPSRMCQMLLRRPSKRREARGRGRCRTPSTRVTCQPDR